MLKEKSSTEMTQSWPNISGVLSCLAEYPRFGWIPDKSKVKLRRSIPEKNTNQ